MKSFFTPFKVGLVIIGAIAALLFMFARVSSSLLGEDSGYTVKAHIADATGIAAQTRVMLAGIAVGVVDSITLDGQQALLTLRLREDVRLFAGEPVTRPDGTVTVRDGASITKKQASLLGDYYIELAPGLRGATIGEGQFIEIVHTPIAMDDLMEQMGRIVTNVEQVTADVKQVTGTLATVFGGDQGVQKLDIMVADLQKMVATLSDIATTNQSGINNIVANVEAATRDIRTFTSGAGNNVERILADVSAMTTELRYIIGQSSGDVAEGLGTLKGTLASLQLALDNLNYSLENVQEITDRINDGQGTVGRLINDDGIAVQTEKLLTNANDVVGGVSRLQTWIELRSEWGFNERAFKNYLQLSLRPSEDKFYILEMVDDPRGFSQTTRTVRVGSNPDDPPVVTETTTETTERFKISFLLGRRWALDEDRNFLIGGRFGLIESSGGVGANAWFFDEQLELRADLFDFGKAESARLRGAAMLRLGFLGDTPLLRQFFVQAGFDDAFNELQRDWFLGGGLFFNDQDLKGLFVSGAVPTSF